MAFRDLLTRPHQSTGSSPSPRGRLLRRAAGAVAAATLTTGTAIAGGVVLSQPLVAPTATGLDSLAPNEGRAPQAQASISLSAAELAERAVEPVSRSDRRAATDPAKRAALSQEAGRGITRSEDLASEDPRDIARALLPQFGFSADQFDCLDALYASESGWRVDADNPSSSAYGIPQALPGSKMASAGADWATNPATQIRWGLGYIADRYGSPCGAWSFKQGNGWY